MCWAKRGSSLAAAPNASASPSGCCADVQWHRLGIPGESERTRVTEVRHLSCRMMTWIGLSHAANDGIARYFWVPWPVFGVTHERL